MRLPLWGHSGSYPIMHRQASDIKCSYGFNDLWMMHAPPFGCARNGASASRRGKHEVMKVAYRIMHMHMQQRCWGLHPSKHILCLLMLGVARKQSDLIHQSMSWHRHAPKNLTDICLCGHINPLEVLRRRQIYTEFSYIFMQSSPRVIWCTERLQG